MTSLLPKIFGFTFLLFMQNVMAADSPDLIPISPTMMRKLKRNVVIADSDVQTSGGKQSLHMQVVGLHPKACSFALPKLAMYEYYYQFLDLVKKSVYNDQTQHLYLKVNHDLLPFPMVLYFKVPRINRPGHYQFSFDRGFMKGLIGKIHIRQEGKRCLMMTRADWEGPVSKIPDSVFQVFTTTLSRLTAETLFRISRTL